MDSFADRTLAAEADTLAPDGSEIRLLAQTSRASMCHARLPPGATALAVRHRTVDEVWFCLSGRGRIRRVANGDETIVELVAGRSIAIPCGTAFEWRNLGAEPLDVLIATTPPWPGPDEADFVALDPPR